MTAKERFLATPAAKSVASMLASKEFETALDVAILEAMQALGTAQDSESAAARHWRLEGVALLARTLVKVATPEAQPVTEQFGHLKGNV
jgi:hypothetical protein